MIQRSLPQICQYILLLLHASLQKIDKRLPITMMGCTIFEIYHRIGILLGYLVYKMQHLKKKERVFEDYIRRLKSFHQTLLVMLFLETDICTSEIYVHGQKRITYSNNDISS